MQKNDPTKPDLTLSLPRFTLLSLSLLSLDLSWFHGDTANGRANDRYLGSALAMLFVPYIVQELGPGMQFQVSGLIALVWLTMWWRVGADQPPESGGGAGGGSSGSRSPTGVEEGSMEAVPPFNKKEDPMPLLQSHGSHSTSSAIGGGGVGGGRDSKHGKGCGRADGGTGVPWGILIRSSAVWAIVTNNFAFHYATYVLMNWLPTYFQDHIGVGLSDMSNWYTVSVLKHENDFCFLPYIVASFGNRSPPRNTVCMRTCLGLRGLCGPIG